MTQQKWSLIALVGSICLWGGCLPRIPRAVPNRFFDWQGHRGCRGLLPENTIPGFLKSLDLGVTTLEMDLAISADGVVLLSHEPWMNTEICSKPDGQPVSEAEAPQLALYKMTAAAIQSYDCGRRGHPRFPEQQAQAATKPSLEAVVTAVKAYCAEKKRPLPYFNIEIKSQPQWDNLYTPPVATFAERVVATVKALGIEQKTCIQSFDARALEAVYTLNKTVQIAYLVENTANFEDNMKLLSFRPTIYSPHYLLVTEQLVRQCRSYRMRLIPWTVNDVAIMKKLKKIGVDGIITDYPDRINGVR